MRPSQTGVGQGPPQLIAAGYFSAPSAIGSQVVFRLENALAKALAAVDPPPGPGEAWPILEADILFDDGELAFEVGTISHTVAHVDQSIAQRGCGDDWSTARQSLSSAIADAVESGGTITQIWVSRRMYTPEGLSGSNLQDAERRISFELVHCVSVYAGFPPSGGTIYVRLWSMIDGDWELNDYTYTAASN